MGVCIVKEFCAESQAEFKALWVELKLGRIQSILVCVCEN